MPRKITLEQVERIACPITLVEFKRAFGDSVEATRENLLRAPPALWNSAGVSLLLSPKNAKKMFHNAPSHFGYSSGRECPACMYEMLKFIELYNLEGEESERLLDGGKQQEPQEPPAV